jgi:type IV secretion system protein VirB8
MNAHPSNLKASNLKREAYYAEAASWATDTHGTLRRGQRLAWTVAAVAGAVAALEALALVLLMPLKTVQPYVVTVDRQTGYMETARGVAAGPLSQSEAVTQSFLAQYVLSRETFDATDLRDAYRRVQLWSAGDAREAYVRSMQQDNPASPLKLYPPTTRVTTTVKSVSLLSPTTALVRFETERRDAGATAGVVNAWSAAIAFRYSGAPLKMEDRLVNPLGFQVTRYRRDAEGAVR